MLWALLTAMSCSAAVLVAIPLIRRYEASEPALAPETGIYREQLAEVDRDLAAGSITADQAALAKVEIQRRLIATTRAADMARPVSNAWRTAALASVTGFVALASVNLYGLYGHPESVTAERSVEAVTTAETAAPPAAGAVDAMIGKLAARLKASPGDADGWRMLGWSYFSTQRYSEAADAYGKAMALEPGNQSYRSAHAEALVQAQGGTVTDEALAIFETVLQADPTEERSRFYKALATEQAGQLSKALDLWTALLADAPPDAPWLVDVRGHVTDLGERTGRNMASALASASAPATPDDGGMAGSDQQAMILGMVEGLSARLEASPHDAEGWMRLIRSRSVLNQPDLAREALQKALDEFKSDAAAQGQIASLARQLGIVSE